MTGQPEVGNALSQKVWWWGRGTRWPGWYIIAYLSGKARHQLGTTRYGHIYQFHPPRQLRTWINGPLEPLDNT